MKFGALFGPGLSVKINPNVRRLDTAYARMERELRGGYYQTPGRQEFLRLDRAARMQTWKMAALGLVPLAVGAAIYAVRSVLTGDTSNPPSPDTGFDVYAVQQPGGDYCPVVDLPGRGVDLSPDEVAVKLALTPQERADVHRGAGIWEAGINIEFKEAGGGNGTPLIPDSEALARPYKEAGLSPEEIRMLGIRAVVGAIGRAAGEAGIEFNPDRECMGIQ